MNEIKRKTSHKKRRSSSTHEVKSQENIDKSLSHKSDKKIERVNAFCGTSEKNARSLSAFEAAMKRKSQKFEQCEPKAKKRKKSKHGVTQKKSTENTKDRKADRESKKCTSTAETPRSKNKNRKTSHARKLKKHRRKTNDTSRFVKSELVDDERGSDNSPVCHSVNLATVTMRKHKRTKLDSNKRMKLNSNKHRKLDSNKSMLLHSNKDTKFDSNKHRKLGSNKHMKLDSNKVLKVDTNKHVKLDSNKHTKLDSNDDTIFDLNKHTNFDSNKGTNFDSKERYIRADYNKFLQKQSNEFLVKRKFAKQKLKWSSYKRKAQKRYKAPSAAMILREKTWREADITQVINFGSVPDPDSAWPNILVKKRKMLHDRNDAVNDYENSNFDSDEIAKFEGDAEGKQQISQAVNVDEGNNLAEPVVLRAFPLLDGVVLVNSFPELVLHGRARLSVLHGTIDIYGTILAPRSPLTSSSPPVNVFSDKSNSLVRVKSVPSTGHAPSRDEIVKFIESLIPREDWDKILQRVTLTNMSVLFFKRTKDQFIDVLDRNPKLNDIFSFDLLPSSPWNTLLHECGIPLSVSPPPQDEGNNVPVKVLTDVEFYKVSEKWMEVLEKNPAAIILTCGGKNSGKSTLSRYLVNSILNGKDSVMFLDCDLGQTEFSPPGTISLHRLSQPIIGPPYTHQKKAVFASYFGAVTPANHPRIYSTIIRDVYKQYTSYYQDVPLIVNTMGWVNGLGFHLLIDVLHIIRPHLIAQLVQICEEENLPPLVPDYLASAEGWLYNPYQTDESNEHRSHSSFCHDVILVKSNADNDNRHKSSLVSHKPRDYRDMVTLANLLPTLGDNYHYNLLSVTPVKVTWNSVAIVTAYETYDFRYILEAINGCSVALCKADISKAQHVDGNEEWPLVFETVPANEFVCLGVIRNIDMDEGLLYVISSCDPVEKRKFNTIIKCSDPLPDMIGSAVPLREETHQPYGDIMVRGCGTPTLASSVTPHMRYSRT